MINRSSFYHTAVVGPDTSQNERDLRRRWGKDDTVSIRNAIISKVDLPRIFPQVEVLYAGKIIKLEDLRGIDLSGTEIGEYDLAYCALDFSNMEDCVFEGTYFQYSRLVKASFKRAKLRNVQASPIDGRYLDFSKSTLIGCFMSNSDLSQSQFREAVMQRCDFSQSQVTQDAVTSKKKFALNLPLRQQTKTIKGVLNHLHSLIEQTSRGFLPVQIDQSRVGRVVAFKQEKIEVEVVTVGKKKSSYRFPAKRRVFHVYGNADKVALGEIVQISKVKIEPNFDKGKKVRAAGTTASRVHEHKIKDKWVISSTGEDI